MFVTMNHTFSYHIVQIAIKERKFYMESKKIFEEIKKSMGNFPPFFPEYWN